MNRILVGGLSGLASGMLYGAIGASVAGAARTKPVLQGAVVSSVIGGTLATVATAILAQQPLKGGQLSGAPAQSATLNGVGGVCFP